MLNRHGVASQLLHDLVLLLQGCKWVASSWGCTVFSERRTDWQQRAPEGNCKGQGFKLWNMDSVWAVAKKSLSWFGWFLELFFPSHRQQKRLLLWVGNNLQGDILNGFHSPTEFVSLKQIQRCCEDLCSTQHIQGPKRALQTEIDGEKIQIHTLKSCRSRLPALETWLRNLEMVDNYNPVKWE